MLSKIFTALRLSGINLGWAIFIIQARGFSHFFSSLFECSGTEQILEWQDSEQVFLEEGERFLSDAKIEPGTVGWQPGELTFKPHLYPKGICIAKRHFK